MPQLDPLQRPDFSPLFSFDAQISEKHESNRFHVLQTGDDFWLRLEGHDDWLGLFDNYNGYLSAHLRASERGHFEFLLVRALESRGWGRALSLFDEDGRLWRVLWRERKSFLMRADTREALAFRSSDDWMRGAWIKPGAHFERGLRREWKSPSSDLRAARSFLELGDDERHRFGLRWERGGWDEMRPILRAVAVAQHEWGERTVVLSRPVYPAGAGQIGFGSNAPQSGRQERLLARLSELNRAVLPDKTALRSMAPRPFSFHAQNPAWPELRVEVEEPSEHERLEARLELRAWVRENAPDLAEEWK